jgi:hypothetical protein
VDNNKNITLALYVKILVACTTSIASGEFNIGIISSALLAADNALHPVERVVSAGDVARQGAAGVLEVLAQAVAGVVQRVVH